MFIQQVISKREHFHPAFSANRELAGHCAVFEIISYTMSLLRCFNQISTKAHTSSTGSAK